MALRYHWGFRIGHTYSHYVARCDAGLGPAVQSDEGCESTNVRSQLNSNGMRAESNSTHDDVVDNEAAELMLADREALGWEEDWDSEEPEKVSDHERDYVDLYDELGSDPEWMDMED